MRSRTKTFFRKSPGLSFSVLIRRFGKLVGFVFIFTLLGYIVYTISIRFFTIRKLEVYGANISVQLDRERFYDQLLFFPSADYRTELLSQYRQIEDIRIRKKLPDTLVLHILLRKPLARLENLSRTVLIDERGIVISEAGPGHESVPVIKVATADTEDGQLVTDGKVLAAVRFLNELDGNILISDITEHDTASLKAISGDTDIFVPQESDYSQIASTLQTLFSRFRMKGTMPSSVDIRFDKPVVIF